VVCLANHAGVETNNKQELLVFVVSTLAPHASAGVCPSLCCGLLDHPLIPKCSTFTHQLKVVHVLGNAEKDIQFEICAQIGFEQQVITLYDRLRRYGFQDRMFGEMDPYGDGGLHGSGLFLHS